MGDIGMTITITTSCCLPFDPLCPRYEHRDTWAGWMMSISHHHYHPLIFPLTPSLTPSLTHIFVLLYPMYRLVEWVTTTTTMVFVCPWPLDYVSRTTHISSKTPQDNLLCYAILGMIHEKWSFKNVDIRPINCLRMGGTTVI